jgi:hypothetical protein
METLTVPSSIRERLGEPGSEALLEMFVQAHHLTGVNCEQRLSKELSALRLDMSNLKFDLLKWCFVFWIGQLAAITAIMAVLLQGMR